MPDPVIMDLVLITFTARSTGRSQGGRPSRPVVTNTYKSMIEEGYYIDMNGNQVTPEQLSSFDPGGVAKDMYEFKQMPRKWGISFSDYWKLAMDSSEPGKGYSDIHLIDFWERDVANVTTLEDLERAMNSRFADVQFKTELKEAFTPGYLSGGGVAPDDISQEILEGIYPEAQPLDFNDDTGRASGLYHIAMMRYLEAKFPGTQITQEFMISNPNAWNLMLLKTALEDGDQPEVVELIGDPFVSGFWGNLQPHVTFRTVDPSTEATPEQDKMATIIENLTNQIRNYQAIHGAEEGLDKMMDYLKQYAEEFDWAKMDGQITVEGVTAAFPSIWAPEEIARFEAWVREKEIVSEEAMSEAEKQLQRSKVQMYVNDIYYKRYGPAGTGLAALALAEAKAYGSELLSVGEVLTPEAALARWVPSDVRALYELMGVSPNEYLKHLDAMVSPQALRDAGISTIQPISPEMSSEAYRGIAVDAALASLRGGELAPEVAAQIRFSANETILKAPPPEGGARQFFLTAQGGQEQYRTYLAGALPAGKYRNTAWEYYPQLLSNFPDINQLGGPEKFQKYMEGLGDTFYARLSPKEERATSASMVRPPGGGRLPMRG